MAVQKTDSAPPAYVVPAFVVQSVAAAVTEEGLDAAALMRQCGIALLDGCSDGLARIPLDSYARFLRAASTALSDPLLGLKLGSYLSESNLHRLGPVIVSSPTLRAALASVMELQRPLTGGLVWGMRVYGAEAQLGPVPMVDADPSLRLNLDLALTLITRVWERFVQPKHRNLFRVDVRHARTHERDAYARVFGSNVRLAAPSTLFSFPARLLDEQRHGTDARNASALKQAAHAEFESATSSEWSQWKARIERMLEGTADLSRADLPSLAARCQVSARSLRRKIEAEGTSFREILAQVRFRRAAGELRAQRMQIREIALSLGYSDASAFDRAFKRWSGQSPSEYRARASSTERPP